MTKIAVIEDDLPIQDMYLMKLRSHGFDAQGASDGVQGLELIKTFKPELILLDLRMPIMTGENMLRQLRSQDWGKDVLVIILTNISASEAPMELRLLKVEKYIVKANYTPTQVLDVVLEVLEKYNKRKKA